MVLVKAAFCVKKKKKIIAFLGVLVFSCELHPQPVYFLDSSRPGLEGACLCGQPVKGERSSS